MRPALLLAVLLALAVPAYAAADGGHGEPGANVPRAMDKTDKSSDEHADEVVPPANGETGGHEENAAQTADALALQALAILEQRQDHEEAIEKLDAVLESEAESALNLGAIRAAHEALHEEQVEAARQLLQRAFPGSRRHVVGLTFRPRIGTAGLVVLAAIGSAAFALAAAGLTLRRRAERRLAAAADEADPA